jgi:integrase
MLKKYTFKGSIYKKDGRYYWKVKLAGELKRRTIPLARTNEPATKSEALAYTIAQRIWDEAEQKLKGKNPSLVTIGELKKSFIEEMRDYYPPNSPMNNEVKLAMQLLDEYDKMPVNEFGPKLFKDIRNKMVNRKDKKFLSVKTVNERADFIRRLFEWGVTGEIVLENVSYSLTLIKNVTSRTPGVVPCKTREAVSIEILKETLPYMNEIVRAMVLVQFYTGSRPTEIIIMRPCDIDSSTEYWTYKPAWHKTKWRGHNRKIIINKHAQNIIAPLLIGCRQDDYIFKPIDACDNKEAKVGEFYAESSYRNSIKRAIERMNEARKKIHIENGGDLKDFKPYDEWTPYQIRHAAATKIRKEKGDDGLSLVQSLLGQKSIKMAEVYAKLNDALAVKAAEILEDVVLSDSNIL